MNSVGIRVHVDCFAEPLPKSIRNKLLVATDVLHAHVQKYSAAVEKLLIKNLNDFLDVITKLLLQFDFVVDELGQQEGGIYIRFPAQRL